LPASPLAVASALPIADSSTKSHARSLFAGLPLTFEPNQGQGNLDAADPRTQFVARGSGYSLFLGSQGAILSLASPSKSAAQQNKVDFLQMKLAGASPNATLAGVDPQSSVSNYFLGHDPAGWRRAIPQFGRVRYENVYPGINLLFYGNQGHLEYDFQVAPGSDPAQAELEFSGAKQVELRDGALVIATNNGSVRLEAPSIYQQIDGRRQTVAGNFVLRGATRAGFAIGPYDHSRELVIDPKLAFSTYFGGSGDEHSTSVAVDGAGNIYLTGSTNSPNLPAATGVFQDTLNGAQNVYIAEITPPLGSNPAILQYVTYLGGSGTDTPVGIGVDAAGDPFVAGTTTSTDFPTSLTAYQTAIETGSTGTQHVFVTELNNTPTAQQLLYSTYLSGSGDDIASGMAIDSKGHIVVTGTTTSVESSTTDQFPATNLPQPLPYQNLPRAAIQFFVTEINTNAPRNGSIAYSTYFGGGNFDTTTPIATGGGVAIDSNGNIYFSGTTNFTYTGCAGCQTTDFPILAAYQPCLNAAPPVTIVNPPTCPTTTGSTNPDAFVAKLNPNATQGSQLKWSTYLGGSQTDSSTGVALDSGAANVFITGTTNSPDISSATTFASYQRCLNTPVNPVAGGACPTVGASTDAFVARFPNLVTTTTSTNLTLTYFSYLGGSADDAGLAITADASGDGVVTGWTQSSDFPVSPNPNAIQSTLNGSQDACVASLNSGAVTGQNLVGSWANYFGGGGVDQGTGVAVDVNGAIYLAGDTNSANLLLDKPLEPANNGGYDSFVTQLTSSASLSITGTLTLGTNQAYIAAGNQATFTYIVTNNGPDSATGIVVTDDIRPATTILPVAFNSATASSGTCSGGSTSTTVSCTINSLQSGSTATITIVLTPTATSTGDQATFNGGAVVATGANNITPAQTSVSAVMSDFSVNISPPNASVLVAGDTATYQIQLTPHPVYVPNISVSVSGLPNGATSAFTTNPVILQGTSPGTTTLNIATTARPIPVPQSAGIFFRHFYALWLPVPGLALLGFAAAGDRRRRRIAGLFMLSLVFTMLILQPACSKSTSQIPASGTPAGTFTLTLTATSGSDSKSQSFLLTVP
jgi:uncharacterized repeat protein (TIGR01451 family)